jgi:hypothetical protein
MLRGLVPLLTLGVLIATGVGLVASPATASSLVTATSVAPTATASCSYAGLDLGIAAGAVTAEFGLVTTMSGQIGGFDPKNTGLAGFDGLYEDFTLSIPAQLEGTIIGSYAWVGTDPPTAADTAEWFVLYRCSDSGANEVLDTCFGDYGTCPQTAAEAAEALFAATVDDTTPEPGQTITVTAESCFYPLGGALLLDGATSLGGDTTPTAADGTFQIPLTVPADIARGTALTVRVDCGFDGETVLTVTVPVTVASLATTTVPPSSTTLPATPTTAAPAVKAAPTYTG